MLSDSGVAFTNAVLTESYWTGAVVNGPKGTVKSIKNTDWTDAQLVRAQH